MNWLILPLVLLSADYGDIQARVVRVHDGDSITVSIDGYPPIIREVEVRVNGIDTPEIHDKRPEIRKLAERARAFTADIAKPGTVVWLRHMARDKYFRINATVERDGRSLAAELLKAKLARPYDGKAGPKPW